MNILYRNLGQYTAQNKNCHLMKPMMIPWRVSLKFRTYNPGKITKYGVLVRMVCEAVLGYICNMEIYSVEGKKLEDTVLSLSDRNVGQSQNRHVYQDNYYNSVRLAQTLLDRNLRVCGIMWANRGNPRDLEEEGKHLKKGQSAFRGKCDVMVQVWEEKTLVRMTSAIHDATIVNTGRKDRQTNMEIKKPYAVVPVPYIAEGRREGRPVPQLLLSPEENCKMVGKKVVLYLLNCALFNAFFCLQDTRYKQKGKVQELPARGRKVLDMQ